MCHAINFWHTGLLGFMNTAVDIGVARILPASRGNGHDGGLKITDTHLDLIETKGSSALTAKTFMLAIDKTIIVNRSIPSPFQALCMLVAAFFNFNAEYPGIRNKPLLNLCSAVSLVSILKGVRKLRERERRGVQCTLPTARCSLS
ncbi:uncharacterized protein LOC110988146 [Acanthaster planci]|uniref:Uncharacterized protein LOC110988146 n=1 Tax=Acanthaster planci TaxID=133434 RepID=A0A8B7ZUD3_ACAPL|nr:uncharacterized protein LOC110988146 [Acanthaster planci]